MGGKLVGLDTHIFYLGSVRSTGTLTRCGTTLLRPLGCTTLIGSFWWLSVGLASRLEQNPPACANIPYVQAPRGGWCLFTHPKQTTQNQTNKQKSVCAKGALKRPACNFFWMAGLTRFAVGYCVFCLKNKPRSAVRSQSGHWQAACRGGGVIELLLDYKRPSVHHTPLFLFIGIIFVQKACTRSSLWLPYYFPRLLVGS